MGGRTPRPPQFPPIPGDSAEPGPGGMRPSIFTFDGDRETFDLSDPLSWLRVDDEIWRLSP